MEICASFTHADFASKYFMFCKLYSWTLIELHVDFSWMSYFLKKVEVAYDYIWVHPGYSAV